MRTVTATYLRQPNRDFVESRHILLIGTRATGSQASILNQLLGPVQNIGVGSLKQNVDAFKHEVENARAVAILGDEEMVASLENQPDFLKYIFELQAAKAKDGKAVAPIKILLEQDELKNRTIRLFNRLGISVNKDLVDLQVAPEIFGKDRAIELDALQTYGIDFFRDVVLISAGAQPRSAERRLQALFKSLRKEGRFGIFRLDAIDVMNRLTGQSA